MHSMTVDKVPVGSKLQEPIFSSEGVLLVGKGIIMSSTLKAKLGHFRVSEVNVEDIIGARFDKEKLNLDTLTNLTYYALRKLDFNSIYLCAQTLVDNLIESESTACLKILREYDDSTFQHSINVACYAVALGIRMGISITRLHHLATGALLHDIGKAFIPIEIITKEGKLTDDEFRLVKAHPTYGWELLRERYDVPVPVAQIVYQHHEDYDGAGYPNGIDGSVIYDLAMIVHIIDVYDALNSKRSYKVQFAKEDIFNIMDSYRGTKFDPVIYDIFKKECPWYYIGEEIKFDNGLIGVVTKQGATQDNPEIFINDTLLSLNEYKKTLKVNTGTKFKTIRYLSTLSDKF